MKTKYFLPKEELEAMAVKQVGDPSLYGVVVHEQGRVTGFQEKPPTDEEFDRDAGLVQADLSRLKEVVERAA